MMNKSGELEEENMAELMFESHAIVSNSEVLIVEKAKPTMLSPNKSSSGGYQYPKADTQEAIYSTKFTKTSSFMSQSQNDLVSPSLRSSVI